MSVTYIIKLQSLVITINILVAHIYIYKVVFENFRFDGALAGNGITNGNPLKTRLQKASGQANPRDNDRVNSPHIIQHIYHKEDGFQ